MAVPVQGTHYNAKINKQILRITMYCLIHYKLNVSTCQHALECDNCWQWCHRKCQSECECVVS